MLDSVVYTTDVILLLLIIVCIATRKHAPKNKNLSKLKTRETTKLLCRKVHVDTRIPDYRITTYVPSIKTRQQLPLIQQ